ncbi:ArsC family reductase [Marinospirillum sp.]|uniref:ArsC family reductase n=1 Tax=Marinospirillum sp. TaxID=2183934 RepID=UPI003A88C4E7
MLTVYGIPNCQTVKKARQWLQDQGLDYAFHDYKKQGVDAAWLRDCVDQLGWEVLVNRRGTTWRQLPAEEKQALLEAPEPSAQQALAIQLMSAHPSLIKRPLVTGCMPFLVGFDADLWQQQLLG